jgi:membrane protein implicated in regulation of membrane protease activity
MNWAVYGWLGLIVLFLIVEAACPFHLVSIWFAVGSLAALLVGLLGAPVWLQVSVFILVSAVAITALWPLVRKFINPSLTKTNVDAVIGSTGLVTVAIDNVSAVGQVKLGAMYWTARSESGEPIPEGTLVKVDRIEGVKVFVSPVKTPATP